MGVSPQLITENPLWLTGRQDVYTAEDFRKPLGDTIGAGCADADSFKVRQRAAGANMSVDCMAPNVLNRAWVRASQTLDLGMYRVDFLSAIQVNLDVPASDPALPRIDQVFLCVEDTQIVGGNDRATARLVPGTPTAAADLDNRNGAGAAPANMASLHLTDILVPNGSLNVPTANIRDRRHMVTKSIPETDGVTFIPHSSFSRGLCSIVGAGKEERQAVALMYLPKRKNAVGIQWRYHHGAVASNGSWSMGIFGSDKVRKAWCSGIPFVGALNTDQIGSVAFTSGAGWFEPGWYYILYGGNTPTGGAVVTANGVSSFDTIGACAANNVLWLKTTGGVTVPAHILSGFTDAFGLQLAVYPGVPIFTLV